MARAIESDARLKNYRVNVVTFSVVREAAAPAPAKLNGPAEVAALAREVIPDDGREHFYALYLNAQNGLIAVHAVSVGTVSATLVHAREVFGPALRLLGVSSVVLIHNHPSGEATPSREDIRLTRQLVEAARLLDLRVHDHVVIGNGTGSFVSLAEQGVI